MKVVKFRDMSDVELQEKIKYMREEYFNLSVQKQIGQLDNPLRPRFLRRDIARALTVLQDRGLSEELGRAKTVPPLKKAESVQKEEEESHGKSQ